MFNVSQSRQAQLFTQTPSHSFGSSCKGLTCVCILAPNGLGADFLLDVVLSEGKLTPSWQGLLSQLLVLGRLVEEFPHLLTSPIAITGTVNAESLVAVDLAVRAVSLELLFLD